MEVGRRRRTVPSSPSLSGPSLFPLDVDIILHNVMTFCGTTDLYAFRRVCRSWARLTPSLLRKRSDVVVNLRKKYFQKFVRHFAAGKLSGEFPYHSFKLVCWDVEDCYDKDVADTLEGHVKKLILDYLIVTEDDDSSDDQEEGAGIRNEKGLSYFLQLFKQLSTTLEVLDLDGLHPSIARPSPARLSEAQRTILQEEWMAVALRTIIFPVQASVPCRRAWTLIFKKMPNLTEISLNHEAQSTPIFKALYKANLLRQITKVRMEKIMPQQVLMMLEETFMALTELKINIMAKDVSRRSFELLLLKNSSSLRVLALGSPENNMRINITFPVMKNLQQLGMYHCDDSLITLEGLDFRRCASNLKELAVTSAFGKFQWKNYFNHSENVSFPILPELSSLTLELLVKDPECCSYLGNAFPNITKLTLEHPEAAFLKRVWTSWHRVKEIRLFLDSNTPRDFSVCGFSAAWLKRMNGILGRARRSGKSLGDAFKNSQVPEGFCGIQNMKELQTIIIEEEPSSTDYNIKKSNLLSDIAVYFCLSKLEDLRVLKIGRSQISRGGIQYLQRNLKMLQTVDIRDATGPGLFNQAESTELLGYISYYRHQNGEN